jgi:predicted phosphodiesterase
VKADKAKLVTSLPLVRGRATRFVLLNDVHVPDNIPLDGVMAFVESFKPDHVILNGDILDLACFSAWERGTPRRARQMPYPADEYGIANERFFAPLRRASGKAAITYHLGNHEHRAERAIDAYPEGQGYWEVHRNVQGVDQYVENRRVFSLGKLWLTHGDLIDAGNSQTAARRLLNQFRRSMRVGHWHTLEEVSHTSPIDIADRHTVRVCGTLQKFDPDYMKHRPHAWIYGFTYGFVEPGGTFWDSTVRINNGRFYAEGKAWS